MANSTVSTHSAIKEEATSAELETLNFKVSGEFKKEFKGYAVAHGISMLALLKEGFELSKKRRST